MQNVEDINKNKPHFNAYAICLHLIRDGYSFTPCFNKWIATFPEGTNLLKLECPKCGAQDSFASFIPTEYK